MRHDEMTRAWAQCDREREALQRRVRQLEDSRKALEQDYEERIIVHVGKVTEPVSGYLYTADAVRQLLTNARVAAPAPARRATSDRLQALADSTRPRTTCTEGYAVVSGEPEAAAAPEWGADDLAPAMTHEDLVAWGQTMMGGDTSHMVDDAGQEKGLGARTPNREDVTTPTLGTSPAPTPTRVDERRVGGEVACRHVNKDGHAWCTLGTAGQPGPRNCLCDEENEAAASTPVPDARRWIRRNGDGSETLYRQEPAEWVGAVPYVPATALEAAQKERDAYVLVAQEYNVEMRTLRAELAQAQRERDGARHDRYDWRRVAERMTGERNDAEKERDGAYANANRLRARVAELERPKTVTRQQLHDMAYAYSTHRALTLTEALPDMLAIIGVEVRDE